MAIELEVKKWGNSMAVILPKELVNQKHIKEHEKIFIDVVKKVDLTKVFGTLKLSKSGQELKDMVREGWD
jgi:antitoxin component of MazEF toxin-antitoxin module